MTRSNVPEDDLVDELLHVEGPTGVDRTRLPLLAETTSVVRRRRMARRLGVVAALAGCYLAGLLTTWAVAARGGKPGPIRRDAPVVRQWAAPEETPQKAVPSVPESSPSRDARPRRPAPGPRGTAVARADFEHIRRVSDRYLHEQGDLVTALHYYRRALKEASTEERAISVEKDSWLLMALKQARIEEDPENAPDA